MKLYVKRDRFGTFQKAKIEIADSKDWARLTIAVRNALEKSEEHRAAVLETGGDVEYWDKEIQAYKNMYELLDNKNELEWE